MSCRWAFTSVFPTHSRLYLSLHDTPGPQNVPLTHGEHREGFTIEPPVCLLIGTRLHGPVGYVPVPLKVYACKISAFLRYGSSSQCSSPAGTPRMGETPSRHAGSVDYPATTGRHTLQGL
jgi:hypothetical protein